MGIKTVTSTKTATLLAGIPSENPSLFHRVRFPVGDPAAYVELHEGDTSEKLFIVRDIEMDRAKKQVPVDKVFCPADFTPSSGLSGDRATATAQAVAECLARVGVTAATADRSLPYIFAWHIQQRGIAVDYSPELGVLDRRVKDDQELAWLAEAQKATEEAMLMACQTIARAKASSDGILQHDGAELTSERMQAIISSFLLDIGYTTSHGSIVATKPHSSDCHERGAGPLRTGEAVIVDIFPQSMKTHYNGDCTRTVVHGDPSDTMLKMHAAVVAAKELATAATVVGATADDVHSATKRGIESNGFKFARGQVSDEPVMPHGTGHGIGLEVHEPILLDDNGGELLCNEVFTIEPGLYSRLYGGVRVENMVVTTNDGPQCLNSLPEGLDWK